jgi:N-acylneuraminate cytidylyltransferase/CMP-N,N'-diacetyllegionaminic acid synthase
MGNTIALIPARGGSKGLPGKNIRLLAGKPLIQYAIDVALACPLIDTVYVSTDDPGIADLAVAGGSQLSPLRPHELATDTASAMDVVRHFLAWYEQHQDEPINTLVLLQPTSPLRTVEHVMEALLLYQELQSANTSVVSVTPIKPLAWQASIADDGQLAFYQQQANTNRQIQPINYQLNGAIYIAPPACYQTDQLLTAPVYPYVMPPEVSVDIDTLADFLLAESLLTAMTTPYLIKTERK